MGFWVGTQPNVVLALFGFLSFFVIGVALIRESFRKSQSDKAD